jgi:hypothetical protein
LPPWCPGPGVLGASAEADELHDVVLELVEPSLHVVPLAASVPDHSGELEQPRQFRLQFGQLIPGHAVHFADLEDPSAGHAVEHPFCNILIIALCAIICGASTFTEMAEFGRRKRDWLAKWLDLSYGVPNHGRTDERSYYVVPVPEHWALQAEWPGVRAWGMALRTSTSGGQRSDEVRLYILSSMLSGRRFAEAVRQHC